MKKLSQRNAERIVASLFGFLAIMVLVAPAFADAYAGQQLLEWARMNVIAPLGLFAIVVAIGAAIFKPELVKTGIWAAVVCAFLFFLISEGNTLQGIFKNG